MMTSLRTREPDATLWTLPGPIGVRCPRCAAAVPIAVPAWPLAGGEPPPRLACGHVDRFPAVPARSVTDGDDPWFGLPLALRVPIGRHLPWAWNADHLALLERWLGATLRERSRRPFHRSMASRLPGWIQTAAMRPKLVEVIADLRAQALAEGIR